MAHTKALRAKRNHKVVTMDGKRFKHSPRNEDIQALINYLSGLNATGQLTGIAFGLTLKGGGVRFSQHMTEDNSCSQLVGALERVKLSVMADEAKMMEVIEDGPNVS